MLETIVTKLFTALDQSATLLSKNENSSYLDGLIKTGPYIIGQEIPEPYKKELIDLYEVFWSGSITQEDIRRAFQLAVLKGLKTTEQAHHHVTPDTIALFMGDLVNQVAMKSKDSLVILDLAVGSANLLTAVFNHMDGNIRGIGVDVDDLMIQLALTNANLQQNEMELFHQDAFRPLLIDPVDLVVGDLPVGLYPDAETSKSFKVVGDSKEAYSHHMMIEQAINYLKPGGVAILLVPNHLFEEDKNKALYQFIQEEAIILGLLQLPSSMFKNQAQGRSLLMLQKQGEGISKPKQALLAQLPSFTNKMAFSEMRAHIHKWFKERNEN